MHHIDLGLFKYQLDFTNNILKEVGGADLQKKFNDRLRQILCFLHLKLFSKLGQIKVMTAGDYRNVMKIALFALDNIFDAWNDVSCKHLCNLYAKFSKMYIMNCQEFLREDELESFKVRY